MDDVPPLVLFCRAAHPTIPAPVISTSLAPLLAARIDSLPALARQWAAVESALQRPCVPVGLRCRLRAACNESLNLPPHMWLYEGVLYGVSHGQVHCLGTLPSHGTRTIIDPEAGRWPGENAPFTVKYFVSDDSHELNRWPSTFFHSSNERVVLAQFWAVEVAAAWERWQAGTRGTLNIERRDNPSDSTITALTMGVGGMGQASLGFKPPSKVNKDQPGNFIFLGLDFALSALRCGLYCGKVPPEVADLAVKGDVRLVNFVSAQEAEIEYRTFQRCLCHEIGHTLGLVHGFQRPDCPTTFSSKSAHKEPEMPEMPDKQSFLKSFMGDKDYEKKVKEYQQWAFNWKKCMNGVRTDHYEILDIMNYDVGRYRQAHSYFTDDQIKDIVAGAFPHVTHVDFMRTGLMTWPAPANYDIVNYFYSTPNPVECPSPADLEKCRKPLSEKAAAAYQTDLETATTLAPHLPRYLKTPPSSYADIVGTWDHVQILKNGKPVKGDGATLTLAFQAAGDVADRKAFLGQWTLHLPPSAPIPLSRLDRIMTNGSAIEIFLGGHDESKGKGEGKMKKIMNFLDIGKRK
eukprot:CAMPEP_0177641574 /NCGR_PEP_ID=MMETSP0447-20121125/7135_1 /TAXON_ID=0 /ORGANISM="Stygamoeba regulata, Strain BSH-02190019" /LENGTH=573 /DNA_ID=CAMNT_0019143693 /DNA_START=88 /DNA_END=1807 /DNA_ORIENTATION=-